MVILLDAMGGDNAPNATIKGAVKAINDIKAGVKAAEYFIRTRKEGMYGFVLEPDALVIEESVYYAAGCFVLVRLPGRIVDNRFVFEEFPETAVSEK